MRTRNIRRIGSLPQGKELVLFPVFIRILSARFLQDSEICGNILFGNGRIL